MSWREAGRVRMVVKSITATLDSARNNHGLGAYTTWLLDAQMFRALNETRPSNCPSVLYIFLLRSTWPNHKHYTRQTRSAMRSILWIALIFAQYGRPFIILREQARKTRSHGIEAIKVRKALERT